MTESKNMTKRISPYQIACYDCGKGFSGTATKLSDVREKAKDKGWQTAVPEWAAQSPAVTSESWWQNHPKGKTVDLCPDCILRGQRETIARMNAHLRLPNG
jgi:hypothetical protein